MVNFHYYYEGSEVQVPKASVLIRSILVSFKFNLQSSSVLIEVESHNQAYWSHSQSTRYAHNYWTEPSELNSCDSRCRRQVLCFLLVGDSSNRKPCAKLPKRFNWSCRSDSTEVAEAIQLKLPKRFNWSCLSDSTEVAEAIQLKLPKRFNWSCRSDSTEVS